MTRWSENTLLKTAVLLFIFSIILWLRREQHIDDSHWIALRSIVNPLPKMNSVQTVPKGFNPSVIPLLDGYFLLVYRKTVSHWAGPHSLYLSLAREERALDKTTEMMLPILKPVGKSLHLTAESTFPDDVVDCRNTGTGPEDGRLFYTIEGAPLLQLTGPPKAGMRTSLCHMMWVVDVRTLLNITHLLHHKPTIVYSTLTPLKREGEIAKRKSDKNWAPFLPTQDYGLMYHVDLTPPRYFKVYPDKLVRMHYVDDEAVPCPRRFIPSSLAIHQSTGTLRLTMCNRGQCVPNKDNTVLMAVIQSLKRNGGYRKYTPYVVTWNIHGNLSYRSVSPPVSWPVEELTGKQWFYTHSMTWKHLHKTDPTHGYMDDTVLLMGGWSDKTSHYIDVEASTLMKGHKMCR
ncbi:hypothetical protein PROFUN_06885 [Planoprotostelium fungivorum]|uniref:Uncharacterized protein n=1 Tax=Planoprotostelium fungivorum TaxID=1890364 RepID=A0A2P6NMU6_9EUKA|nr:hypothetical protein PROFUN_06885 [Planoprotostelium fungivorum]